MNFFTVGLDLGKQRDYSALIVLENPAEERLHHIRFLHRWALGTNYQTIIEDLLTQIIPNLQKQAKGEWIHLCVDATGVGAAPVETLAQEFLQCRQNESLNEVDLFAYTITGGQTEHSEGAYGMTKRFIPKLDLAAQVEVALQNKQLNIPLQSPLAETLITELQNFHLKQTPAGNITAAAWRESDHDDLVLALAIALHEARQRWRVQGYLL